MTIVESPHRRLNPLTNEWILVSPHRAKRPWQGQVEDVPDEYRPTYDPTCYLCPGNARVGGIQNPKYDGVFVFDNDFPSLLTTQEDTHVDNSHPLFQIQPERGICRVICFSPRHDWTLAHMPIERIRDVVDVWGQQTLDLAQHEWLTYVQIFENKGQAMGASNPHPHGQIWATERLPREVSKEDDTQRPYFEQHGRTLLSAIIAEELRQQVRVVYENEHWLIVVPFWAIWPFEVMLVAKRAVAYLHDLTSDERDGLAAALSAIAIRYDNLFRTIFPYSMGFHQAPVNLGPQPHWHLHAHFYPPLLRSATVKKFMVGYEMLGTPQRDITPETAAERLRDLPTTRFA